MKLIGKVQICNFMGRGWPVVERLTINEGFPAGCSDGVLASGYGTDYNLAAQPGESPWTAEF